MNIAHEFAACEEAARLMLDHIVQSFTALCLCSTAAASVRFCIVEIQDFDEFNECFKL